MAFQVLPQKGSSAGRFGAGFGQGLSEQIPKEMAQYRLSKGLNDFAKNSKNLSPIEALAKAGSIPGIQYGLLQALPEVLRQQQSRSEWGNSGTGMGMGQQGMQQNEPSTAQQQIQGQEFSGERRPSVEPNTLKGIDATRAQLTPVKRRSDQELFPEAAKLSQMHPATFPTAESALPTVKQNEETRIANLQEQRDVGNTADKLSENMRGKLERYWGKEDTEKNIPGTVQSKLIEKLESQLADPNNRKSENQLIKEVGDSGKRIAKAHTTMNEQAQKRLISGDYTPTKIFDTIKDARKVYEKEDALEEFGDLISDMFGLSAPTTAWFEQPPDNKQVNSQLKPLFRGEYPSIENLKGIEADSEKAADILYKNLGENDNILSYAKWLIMNNLDPHSFIKRIKENESTGRIKFTPRQLEQVTKGYPNFNSLGDLYISSKLKNDKLAD